MTTTINGRTPEEIKRGLECCKPKWEHDRWISCSDDCPFMNEGTFCRIKMQACVSALLQQLERERDAAVRNLKQFSCASCIYEAVHEAEEPCVNCLRNNAFGRVGTGVDSWQWRGVEVE